MGNKTLKEKRLEFLEDTVKHFNLNNRGYNGDSCTYSAGCAIGRHLDKDLCRKLDFSLLSSVDEMHIFLQLPDNLRELGRNFLYDIQYLHDNRVHWNDTGLSEIGATSVYTIKEKYELV